MTVSRLSPDSWIVSTHSRCSRSSSLSKSKVAMPSTPFMGVRSSWLMLATNSDFMREAASASSRATIISCLACRSSSSARSIDARIELKDSVTRPSSSLLLTGMSSCTSPFARVSIAATKDVTGSVMRSELRIDIFQATRPIKTIRNSDTITAALLSRVTASVDSRSRRVSDARKSSSKALTRRSIGKLSRVIWSCARFTWRDPRPTRESSSALSTYTPTAAISRSRMEYRSRCTGFNIDFC